MIKFEKRGENWVVVSDSYCKVGSMVSVPTKKGPKSVTIVKELAKPHGVQRSGSYVYAVR